MPIVIILLAIIVVILAPGILWIPLAFIGSIIVETVGILTSPITWFLAFIFFVLYMMMKGIAHLFKSDKQLVKERADKKKAEERHARLLAEANDKDLQAIRAAQKKRLKEGTPLTVSKDIPKTTLSMLDEKERRLLQVECAQHNASKVLKYLQSLTKPDDRYYAYKTCFQDGRWVGILKESDFQLTSPVKPTPAEKEQADNCYNEYYSNKTVDEKRAAQRKLMQSMPKAYPTYTNNDVV